jgi:hypothetical protein
MDLSLPFQSSLGAKGTPLLLISEELDWKRRMEAPAALQGPVLVPSPRVASRPGLYPENL